MKSKTEIIEELAASHFVENYARTFMSADDLDLYDDIVADLYVSVCEVPAEVLTSIHAAGGINEVRRYVSGLVIRQMRSVKSRVWSVYRRPAKLFIPASLIPNEETLWIEKEQEIIG